MVFYRRIKEMNLVRDTKEAMKKLKWHEVLSKDQSSFILGDLLGDGSISSSGMYQCNHSYKQKAFIDHKMKILSNLLSPNFNMKERITHNNQNGKNYRSYYLRTMSNKCLKEFYDVFYKNGKKQIPFDYLLNSSDFNELSLAAWYMGDGGRKYNVPSLYTFGFGYDGNLQVLMLLKSKFGIEGDLKIDDRDFRSPLYRNYISIRKGENSNMFFSIVEPYIINHFRYKLPKNYTLLTE
jgi:hypothetical protein